MITKKNYGAMFQWIIMNCDNRYDFDTLTQSDNELCR